MVRTPKHARDRHALLLDVGRTCVALEEARGGVVVDADDYFREVADAIESARSYVLLAGWQLESTVLLRRRPEDQGRPRTLGEVVRAAAEKSPTVRFYVLAWDWASVYVLDREWGTRERMIEAGLGRLEFVHDRVHAQGASHHDKLVVVDGHTAWVGGIDLCEHRWDERSHPAENPARLDLRGKPYGPYHDLTAVLRGRAVRALVEHFAQRWERATGETIVLVPDREPAADPACHVSLGRAPVAISRTIGATVLPLQEPVREIHELYVRAIGSAERLIYAEMQYLTSDAIADALARRFEDRTRPLEIVLIVPQELEGRMEKAAIEGRQRAALSALRGLARRTGHRFGVFSPCVPCGAHVRRTGHRPTYVHSKLMIVDDRFLTIGSANATNRSMGLDTELNVSWHSTRSRDHVERGIRALRVSLLAEHTGLAPAAAMRELVRVEGLVGRLGRLARARAPRIVPYPFLHAAEQGPIDELVSTVGDPDRASVAEEIFEEILERPGGLVAKVVSALHSVSGQTP